MTRDELILAMADAYVENGSYIGAVLDTALDALLAECRKEEIVYSCYPYGTKTESRRPRTAAEIIEAIEGLKGKEL